MPSTSTGARSPCSPRRIGREELGPKLVALTPGRSASVSPRLGFRSCASSSLSSTETPPRTSPAVPLGAGDDDRLILVRVRLGRVAGRRRDGVGLLGTAGGDARIGDAQSAAAQLRRRRKGRKCRGQRGVRNHRKFHGRPEPVVSSGLPLERDDILSQGERSANRRSLSTGGGLRVGRVARLGRGDVGAGHSHHASHRISAARSRSASRSTSPSSSIELVFGFARQFDGAGRRRRTQSLRRARAGRRLGGSGAWPSARRRRASPMGFKKASILAALINALFLLVAVGAIAAEAVRRLFNPAPTRRADDDLGRGRRRSS